MGEMADWAYDMAISEELEYEELDYYEATQRYMQLPITNLMEELKDALTHEYYDYNEYTDLICNIYMAHESGYVLSEKQRKTVALHLAYQRCNEWY